MYGIISIINMRPFRPVVKTVPFHGKNTGSIPVKVMYYNYK